MAWSAAATFFLLAAVVQIGLALAILARRARVEWASVLAAIFLLNGALAVNSLLADQWPQWSMTGAGTRIFFDLDRTVTVLIAYMALAYPQRPRWARRSWILPLIFGVVLASILIGYRMGWPDHTTVPAIDAPAECPDICTHPNLYGYWIYGYASIGFLILMVRWAYLLPRLASPTEAAQMRLLFAAFAVRGVHVELQFYGQGFLELALGNDFVASVDPYRWVLYVRAALSLLAIGTMLALLLGKRSSVASDRRRAIDFVLVFVLIGGLEAITLGGRDFFHASDRTGYFFGVVSHLDVLVLRPILVVYALVRYELLGPWTRNPRTMPVLTAVVGATGYAAGIDPSLREILGPWSLALTIPLAIALGVVTAILVRPYLGPPGKGSVQRYLGLVEDAYRNREASPAKLRELERERQRLGVDPAEAEALRAAVAGRWKGDGLWLPGQRIAGRYELLRLLGSGGWGEVYLADDAVDGRQVVLKRTKALTAVERKALLAEAFTLTKLSHPNLVPLVRTEVVDGEPVLVLEHMPGGSLATRLAKGRLSRDECRAVADGLLGALEAVHAAGLVHGDVKPGNLLFDAEGNVRLGDFGLARTASAAASRLGDPTPSPRSAGTGSVRYTAPEQARGQPSSQASDVYAAGIVLLECLTGRHPIGASQPEYEQRRQVAEDPVEVPAALGAWRGVVARLLEREPSRRPTAARVRGQLPAPGTA